MAVLLKDAFQPNLVQTVENNPALIHGGPFANIAHGCNSVIATTTAMKLADYVVTEAGFGADLGAEKFIDIKCRKADLKPSAVVLVATVRALKYHGGVGVKELATENLDALKKGMVNLERHLANIKNHYGLPCVVAINHRTEDTPAEISLLEKACAAYGAQVVVAKHWAEGGAGAVELANAVVALCEQPNQFQFVYPETAMLWEKAQTVAQKIYGAQGISADAKAKTLIDKLQEQGYGHYPICIAKTQYSFSTDPKALGAPSGHTLHIREVRLAAGAEFIVMVCGDVMTMPGLPKVPSAHAIDVDDSGNIVGLF
jgi:formate--tetrahydrofolate ligase